ncbi:MaoC family dehydratase [Microbacterium schleiferi]|uniref:MaoC family dehydratase n=1 Tax=Microbacterium schleiferi TaxID=69362 RepID=UPI003120038B
MTEPLPRAWKGAPDHYWEDLVAGDEIRTSGITVTEAHLVSWAGLTGDIVEFHLNAAYAEQTPFGARIGHGPLTLSLSLGLLTQTGYTRNVVAWLGLDEVRATKPVLIGDSITVTATVAEARPTSKPGTGVWTLAYTTLNQKGETVMTFRSSFLVRRRPEGESA